MKMSTDHVPYINETSKNKAEVEAYNQYMLFYASDVHS